jgi:photosystem II PsbY protein
LRTRRLVRALNAARCAPFVSQELVQLADGRPLVFAGLFLPVLGWVAFNIGAPALRQIDAMGDKGAAPAKKATKKRAVIAGLTGLSAAALLAAPEAAQAAQVRRARALPPHCAHATRMTCADIAARAVLTRMRLRSLPQDVAQLADGRPLVFAGLFLPVLGWVAFNIGAPALRQIDAMGDKGAAPAKKATKKR